MSNFSASNTSSTPYFNRSSTNAQGVKATPFHSPAKGEGESPVLKPVDSGLWVYRGKEGADSLVPVESTFAFREYKQTVQALNDIYARAYYGCKVWEAELTTRPQEGTGFFNYITPKGTEVFFPMSWCFGKCPPAFLLAAEKDPEELGLAVSYTNVYTSLAVQMNTGLVKSYFRIHEDMEDVTQYAQLIPFGSDRAVVEPESVGGSAAANGGTLTVSISSLTSRPSTEEEYGLENLVPGRVGTFSLASGQVVCRDESRWGVASPAARGTLPPEFVPVKDHGQKPFSEWLVE